MASATEKNVWGQQTSARWWEGKNETGCSEQPVRWLKKKKKFFLHPALGYWLAVAHGLPKPVPRPKPR
jgi:hypothetical protein